MIAHRHCNHKRNTAKKNDCTESLHTDFNSMEFFEQEKKIFGSDEWNFESNVFSEFYLSTGNW